MIAVDSNVLLRYLLNDDPIQSKKAYQLITGNEKVLITDVVLVETIWALKGKRYKLDKDSIVQILNALFAEPNILFEDNQIVWRALNDYKQARPIKIKGKQKIADFLDALIVNKARSVGKQIHKENVMVYTFDKAALQISGAQEP